MRTKAMKMLHFQSRDVPVGGPRGFRKRRRAGYPIESVRDGRGSGRTIRVQLLSRAKDAADP